MLQVTGARSEVSGVLVGSVQGEGSEKRERAGGQGHRACEHANWCARAAGARANWGERREKEEEDQDVA